MKARLENGKIVKYASVPNKVGNILGGAKNLDPESLGFYDVVVPTYDSVTQVIYNLHFDNAYDDGVQTREVFIYDVKDKVISETVDELKATRIDELNKLIHDKLSPTDFYITRKTEKNVGIPSSIQVSRDAIRTTATTKESEINALTTKESILKYDINF